MSDRTVSTEQVDAAATRLRSATSEGRPCPPVRDLLGATDLDLAYRVQSANVGLALAAGRRRVGRKIGLTSPAVQQQLGVDQPDFGSLLDDMAVAPGGVVATGRLLQAKVEAEVAFTLSRDLDGQLESIADVRPAIDSVAAAIEIVDSRVADWDISIVDTIADNASSGLFVVSDRHLSLAEIDPVAVEMTLELNDTPVSSGRGSACLGDPLAAVLWLARAAQSVGEPLRRGELILSGALGPMVAVHDGDHVRADFSDLGPLEVSFAAKENQHG
jgi:2-keto-4-pentenoate hydratase